MDLDDWNKLLLRGSLKVLLCHVLSGNLLHGVPRSGPLHP